MRRRRRIPLSIALVAALVLAVPASTPAFARPDARPAAGASLRLRLLWATVNLCDTTAHPDAVGIRGSMPGTGVRGQRMLMRFRLQWLKDGRWAFVGPTADSGFVDVGSARARARQAGRTFTVSPPRTGVYLLRGVVSFEWRLDGVVLRHARRATTAAHPNTAGSDPPGFSSAMCIIA